MSYYLYMPRTRFLSPWDVVRPRYWYPHVNLEQSLMDMDLMHDEMADSLFPLLSRTMLATPHTDDDFFADLPVGANPSATIPPAEKSEAEHTRACSNYSYSSASVVDDNGKRVTSVRRRYEDSNGRLKAVHEREVDGKRLVTKWNKKDKNDEGEHTDEVSEGTTKEEFEKLWAETPFSKAHEKHENLPEGAKPVAVEAEKKEEPKKEEEPKAEEPKAEEPKAEEPKTEEANKAEEPKAEEPVKAEP